MVLASPWGLNKNRGDAKKLFNRLKFTDDVAEVPDAGAIARYHP